MFDTVNGLPLHPLVVHAVVVLVPLMALLTFLVALLPTWRRFAVHALGADLVVLVLAFVAEESGEALQRRLTSLSGQPAAVEHAQHGDAVTLVVLGMVAAAAVVVAARRWGGVLVPVSVVASAVAGVVAVGWVVVTGESGAAAVWQDVVSNTTAP